MEFPKNVAGIAVKPEIPYQISPGEIVDYLQNSVLGCPIDTRFVRWNGINGDYSYVFVLVGIGASDLCVENSASTYTDRMIAQKFGAGHQFKKTIIDKLKPFMYTDEILNLNRYSDKDRDHIFKYGLSQERIAILNDLKSFKRLEDNGREFFSIALATEAIMAKMLVDPETGKLPGKLRIDHVNGKRTADGREDINSVKSFEVKLDLVNNQFGNGFDLSCLWC